MLQIALWEPEIPPNTGNIARLCAATGCPLHLIGALGFRLDEKSLRRAGLDYWDSVEVHRHDTLAEFETFLAQAHPAATLYCLSARAATPYTRIPFRAGDCLLFGAETRGLPPEALARHAAFTIPMQSEKVRSLNLATAAGIVLYEGLRQLHGW